MAELVKNLFFRGWWFEQKTLSFFCTKSQKLDFVQNAIGYQFSCWPVSPRRSAQQKNTSVKITPAEYFSPNASKG
jgi:hypothetical protein